jgi:hypothetical protein
LTEEELYDYAQFLHEVCHTAVLDTPYHARLRDPNDLDVMQTAERGDADVLCSNDGDFHDAAIISFCTSRGISVFHESTLLGRLVGAISGGKTA